MASFVRYTYSDPSALPLVETGTCPSDADYAQAGFSPEDEEVSVARLAKAWHGHRKGALVITGLTLRGHPFAVAR